jgi:hypothetical protein
MFASALWATGVNQRARTDIRHPATTKSSCPPSDLLVTRRASIMTATRYNVAYPHSSVRPLDRICSYKIDLETYKEDILSKLCHSYPDHTEDLRRASLWKVRPLLPITRFHLNRNDRLVVSAEKKCKATPYRKFMTGSAVKMQTPRSPGILP